MARVMALDYGMKRCGLATTDELQIIASPLDTVETSQLLPFLEKYCLAESVECLVIGEAPHKDGTASKLEEHIQRFIRVFGTKFPDIKIDRYDEHLTSKQASQVIMFSVKSRKKRQEKGLIDKISAAIILQEYLGLL